MAITPPRSAIRLRTAILLPLALSLAVLVATVTYSFFRQEQTGTTDYVGDAFKSAQRMFVMAVKADTEKLSSALELIVEDEGLRRAMLARDRSAMLQRSAPVFQRLRKEYGITHFYFTAPDRVNFLRVHQPARFGDRIDRITTLNAEARGRPASGLELGPLGTFTLRVVFPWYDGKRLIGYVELGEEIEHILGRVKEVAGVDLYLAIDKQHLSQRDWSAGMAMLGRQAEWGLLPESVITYQTTPGLNVPMRALIGQRARNVREMRDVQADQHAFKVQLVPLTDAANREIGQMLLARDITARLGENQREIKIVAGVGLVVCSLLFWLFSVITGREEKRLLSSGAALKESEGRFRSLVESSSDWIWEIDVQHRYIYSSPKLKEVLGYEQDEVLGRTPFDLMPPDEAKRVWTVFSAIVAERRPFTALENLNLHKDGRIVVLETSGVPVFNDDGSLHGYRGVDRDISKRKRAEEALRKSTLRLALHFQQTPLAVIEWDTELQVANWNPAAETIFGYTKAEALGRHAMDLILPPSANARVAEIWQSLLSGQGGHRSTSRNVTKDGRTIWCEWYNTPLIDDSGQVIGVDSLVQDVTEQKNAEKQLHFLAYFDGLTGLPNRALFLDRLGLAIIEAHRHQRLVGVMFMDMDHFKMANDSMGHEAGNLLLKAAAERLESCFRDGDTVARFGGDEFGVVLSDMSDAEDVVRVARKVLEAFRAPFEIAGVELFVSFSIGISLYPNDDVEIERLLRNADSAMYQAKAAGRNNYQFYSSEMTARVEQRMALETSLRYAIERNEFQLHYQPQIDLLTGQVVGVEALLRWRHPERGMISPAEFIPVAEETGLILPIGEWVLRTACTQAKAWQAQGLPPFVVAVNLSARQFKQGLLVQQVMAVLEETQLAPQFLELEITESLLMDGADSLIFSTLENIRKLGITLSIDDFGTGYSSLSYLKRFPIDKLKIDQSFVRGVTSDPDDASLVKAIIAMARSLRLTVIAEGVETEGQLNYLHRHSCDQIQGFFFSRPLPPEELSALVASGQSLRLPSL